jgi:hypothetical protein
MGGIAFILSNTIMIGVKQLCHKHGTLTNSSSAFGGSEHAYLSSGWLVVMVVGIHENLKQIAYTKP